MGLRRRGGNWALCRIGSLSDLVYTAGPDEDYDGWHGGRSARRIITFNATADDHPKPTTHLSISADHHSNTSTTLTSSS